ncbi:MAG TPA: hypothetical protein VGS27_30655 [Candidatus Sulfotelmatobacter sp.]|nr:hypothetical protein [Candidatus Sulfotelmatobacter sp.]
MRRIALLVFLFVGFAQILLNAQEVRIFDRTVQFHGFASQGFVYTSQNNWLTMGTASGSFAMTDMGANVSTALTDKLRIGAQVYDRNMGQLGQWHPTLDWAYADYRFTDWLGIRGGKVKTVSGLYNDTQDMDFLRPFALLPQGVYPTNIREVTIAHKGGDIYGRINLGQSGGSLMYTAFAGERDDSKYGGYFYLEQTPPPVLLLNSISALQYGGDLRWNTPVKGLLVGASRFSESNNGDGIFNPGPGFMPYTQSSKADWNNQFYGQYVHNKFEIDAEYRCSWIDEVLYSGLQEVQTNAKAWYVAGSYRIFKWMQVGSYYSNLDVHAPLNGNESGYIHDKDVTVRFDANRYLNFKLEGHFMDGVGLPGLYPGGFYSIDNPNGLKPQTNALVVKTNFNF